VWAVSPLERARYSGFKSTIQRADDSIRPHRAFGTPAQIVAARPVFAAAPLSRNGGSDTAALTLIERLPNHREIPA
jgi:hypothetical protein